MGNYPLTTTHFQVEWGGVKIGFMEVRGLSLSLETIEVRDGASPEFLFQKMPGLKRYDNIVLKRGMHESDNEFFDWFNTVSLNEIERRDITISLLNGRHEPVVVWKVRNAFPVRVSYPVLDSTSHEPAVEIMELAHEGFRVEKF